MIATKIFKLNNHRKKVALVLPLLPTTEVLNFREGDIWAGSRVVSFIKENVAGKIIGRMGGFARWYREIKMHICSFLLHLIWPGIHTT